MDYYNVWFFFVCYVSNICCFSSSYVLPVVAAKTADARFQPFDNREQLLEGEPEGQEKLVIEKLAGIIHDQQDKQQRRRTSSDNPVAEKFVGKSFSDERYRDNSAAVGGDGTNERVETLYEQPIPPAPPRPPDKEEISYPSVMQEDTGQEGQQSQEYIKVGVGIPTKFQRNDVNAVEYQNKFLNLQAEQTSSSNDKKNSIGKSDQAEQDSIQRKKLYSFLTQNPSFIPYGHAQSAYIPKQRSYYDDKQTTNILAIAYGSICAVLVITIFGALLFYRKLKKRVKDAEDVDYPAYGVTGPSKEVTLVTGDRHLAHSAQMYHYQHQKQQIKAMENVQTKADNRRGSDSASDEDDFTVYECPGLATTGEMEVRNPMFQDEMMETAAVDNKEKSAIENEVENSKNGGINKSSPIEAAEEDPNKKIKTDDEVVKKITATTKM